LPGNLIIVAVEATIVAVIVLAIFLINDAVDVAVADNVLNRVNNLLIVAVDVAEANIDLR
jgi:HAMP domain-containing protein